MIANLLSFCLASFLMALMPGPDNLFVLTESLRKGMRNGILLAIGLNSGILIHTLAAATGLSLIFLNSPFLFAFIQYLGAAYLLFLAYKASKEKAEQPAVQEGDLLKASDLKILKQGLTMNLLNPKVSLFFIAFLPQFVMEDSSWSPVFQMIIFGICFMIIGLLTFSGIALAANQLKKTLDSPRFWVISKWAKVAVLLILAVYLIVN